MKKALLTCLLIVSSAFFAQAQFQVGDTRVNVGRVCGTISGKPACVNPSTGQWEFSNGNGGGIIFNTNTGQVGVGGTINGVPVNVGIAGNGGNGVVGMGGLGTGQSGVFGLLAMAQLFVNRSVPFLVGLAVLAFFWFIIEFIWKGKDSPEHHEKAKKGMFWSVVALFVMVSIWGIIGVIGATLGINQGGSMKGFCLPGSVC